MISTSSQIYSAEQWETSHQTTNTKTCFHQKSPIVNHCANWESTLKTIKELEISANLTPKYFCT